ncbi:MAG: TetR/AcrR family transcriptional regulator [bacterium]|nr:TetR/AcrR family transcriptional regulator [bacterium]
MGIAGRREQKVRETRERIFSVALEAFVRQGYAATTVREIASGAGISAVTFHSHYRTKDHLLQKLAELYLDALMALLDELVDRSQRGEFRAEDFQGLAIEAFGATPTIGRELAIEAQRAILGTPTGKRFTRETQLGFTATAASLQSSGHLRRDFDANTIASAATNFVAGAFHSWLNDPDANPPTDVIEFLVRTFWHADDLEDEAQGKHGEESGP